jgi:hypothetical protein
MPELPEDIHRFGTDPGRLLSLDRSLLPCGGITGAIVAEGENHALLLEPGDLGNRFGTEVGRREVVVLEVADILVHLATAEDKEELVGLEVAQL